MFYVLLAIGVFGLILFPFIPYNTLGEDIKVLKDEGLTLIMVLSIIPGAVDGQRLDRRRDRRPHRADAACRSRSAGGNSFSASSWASSVRW